MSEPDDVRKRWRGQTDARLKSAASELSDYSQLAQEIIREELARRGLWPSEEPAPDRPSRVCPACSSVIASPTAKFCARCGLSLPAVAPAAPDDADGAEDRCPACGADVAPDAACCESCGLTLSPEDPPDGEVANREGLEPGAQATTCTAIAYDSVDVCPACGERLTGDEPSCPSCGLVFLTMDE